MDISNFNIDGAKIEEGIADILIEQAQTLEVSPKNIRVFIAIYNQEDDPLKPGKPFWQKMKKAFTLNKNVVRAIIIYPKNAVPVRLVKKLKELTDLDLAGTVSSMFRDIIVDTAYQMALEPLETQLLFQLIDEPGNSSQLKTKITTNFDMAGIEDLDIREMFEEVKALTPEEISAAQQEAAALRSANQPK